MKIKKLLVIPALVLTLAACGNQEEQPKTDPTSEEGKPLSDHDGYYSSIKDTDEGNALKQLIHNLMIDTHTTYPKYSEFKKTETYQKTCLNPDTNKIVNFYSAKETASYSGTREHVWPCANSSGLWGRSGDSDIGEDYQGGGSDMYHIMPCSSFLNSFRGNSRFTVFTESDGAKSVTDSSGGKYYLKGVGYDANNQFCSRTEVANRFKGDVARIAAYLYIHYSANFGKTNQYTGSLNLSNIIYKPGTESMDYVYRVMVEWNKLDPVDAMERRRNDEVQKIQGNRNPFIDHPEFMAKMFNIEQ